MRRRKLKRIKQRHHRAQAKLRELAYIIPPYLVRNKARGALADKPISALPAQASMRRSAYGNKRKNCYTPRYKLYFLLNKFADKPFDELTKHCALLDSKTFHRHAIKESLCDFAMGACSRSSWFPRKFTFWVDEQMILRSSYKIPNPKRERKIQQLAALELVRAWVKNQLWP